MGICCVDSSKLRHTLANHLEENVSLYSQFLSQPVASHNAYNADTEPPTAEDAYIDTIADSELCDQLHWKNYLISLRNGALGDHIAIHGIANIFNVTINVLSSQCPTMIPVVPRNCSAQHELYVGVILQYGLDKVPMNEETSIVESHFDSTVVSDAGAMSTAKNSQSSVSTSTAENPSTALNDAIIEDTRQLQVGSRQA